MRFMMLAVMFLTALATARASTIEVATFEAPLAEHGVWLEVSGLGHVWHPAHVESGWRPYVTGQWVWTDEGWYWQSEEEWAWATYHYGRWALTSNNGWVWTPGTEWAPSWVVWREGGSYVGWAPLAPAGRSVAQTAFNFVEQAHFAEPIRPSVVVYNETIVNKTVVVSGAGASAGPRREEIQRVTGKTIAVANVRQLRTKEEARAPQAARVAAPLSSDRTPAPASPGAPASPAPRQEATERKADQEHVRAKVPEAIHENSHPVATQSAAPSASPAAEETALEPKEQRASPAGPRGSEEASHAGAESPHAPEGRPEPRAEGHPEAHTEQERH